MTRPNGTWPRSAFSRELTWQPNVGLLEQDVRDPGMSAAIGRRGTGAGRVRELDGLGLAAPLLQAEIERLTAAYRVKFEWQPAIELFVARVESGCPALLLIDTDLLGCPDDLCKFARSLRPDVRVLGVSCYWSERDEALLTCVDAILHKPPRRQEWQGVLRRLGVPLLANTMHAA